MKNWRQITDTTVDLFSSCDATSVVYACFDRLDSCISLFALMVVAWIKAVCWMLFMHQNGAIWWKLYGRSMLDLAEHQYPKWSDGWEWANQFAGKIMHAAWAGVEETHLNTIASILKSYSEAWTIIFWFVKTQQHRQLLWLPCTVHPYIIHHALPPKYMDRLLPWNDEVRILAPLLWEFAFRFPVVFACKQTHTHISVWCIHHHENRLEKMHVWCLKLKQHDVWRIIGS